MLVNSIRAYDLNPEEEYEIAIWNSNTGDTVIHHEYIAERLPYPFEKKAIDFQLKGEDDRLFFNCKVEQWEKLTSLKNKTMGYAVVLATYIHYDNVIYSKSYGKIPADKEDLRELLGGSKATVTRVIKDLTEAELIEEVTETFQGKNYQGYKMNPAYFYRGAHADNGKGQTTKGFNETIRELYNENGAAAVAFIAKLFPYIDKWSNLLVWNPYRSVRYDDPINLNFEDLMEVTGSSKGLVAKYLNITFDGKRVFSKIKDGKNIIYKLNPDIATKTSGLTKEAIRAEFIARPRENKAA